MKFITGPNKLENHSQPRNLERLGKHGDRKSRMVQKPLPNGLQVDRDWDDPPSDPLAFGKTREDGRKLSFSRTTEMGVPSSLANGTCSLLHVSYMFPLCTSWSFPLIPWSCTSFPVAPGTGRNQRPARVSEQ